VWTFTYVRPASIAASTVASTFALPLAPLSHGPQSGTDTGPAVPRAAVCTCAAMPAPVKPLKVSVH
jgi:hypothetical protein